MFFIVGGFVTGNHRRTVKAFRKWQRTKFPRTLAHRAEVKFNNTSIDNELRLKTLAYLTKQDIRIFYSFLRIKNVPEEYRKKKGIETGFLYAEVVSKTLNLLLPTTDLEFRVFRDKRHLRRISQVEFNQRIKLALAPQLSPKALLQIEAVDSTTNPNIQIADWLCGALFRYYNKRRDGDRFFATLKNNIVASEELFKDYWENKKSR